MENVFCGIFFIPIFILDRLIGGSCSDASYTADNLNWAYLAFDTVDGDSVAPGGLQIELLGQPWWHSVTWERAHPFSNAGLWSQAGGTVDSGTAFEPSCTNLQGAQTCSAGEVKFEMTDYFRTLLRDRDTVHYGFTIRALADSPELRLHSVQTQTGTKPRIVANYNCISTSESETNIFFLGKE